MAFRHKVRLRGLTGDGRWGFPDKGLAMHQTRVAVFVHVTWGTWDRLPLLTGEVERAVHRSLSDGCEELGAQVVAVGGVDDHIHLLVRLPGIISLAELMRRIKGASAHLVTHQIAPGEFFKWRAATAHSP
jgi:REP element-mobilizing transposase RayT